MDTDSIVATPPGLRLKLLSIHTPYVEKIRLRQKRWELRTYNPGIMPGDWCVVYETRPTCHVSTVFRTDGFWCTTPSIAWNGYQSVLGIDREAFDAYFNDKPHAYGVSISDVRTFDPIPLHVLRDAHGFSPPQGSNNWTYNTIHKRILDAVTN